MAGKQRFFVLDEWRGLAIIFMVVYHAFYLLAYEFHSEAGRELLAFAAPVQPFIAGSFILICGICCRLSRSNFKRGLLLACVAMLLTLVTLALTLMGIDEVITFGVLHCLAVSVLLFALLQKPLAKLPPFPQIVFYAILFLVTAGYLYSGKQGIGFGQFFLAFPQTNLFPLYALGFPGRTIASADYIPLIPWLFLFLVGTAVGVYAKQGRFPASFSKLHCKPLQWLGQHSLLIYLAHQPILYVFFSLMNMLLKK
jgi:uncharacterized membrane protein